MVDLFGLKKDSETPAPEDGVQDAGHDGGRQKLWLALLVVDSALVIIFGGAVAAKLYQHLYSPVIVTPAPALRHRPAKPAPPPEPPAEAPKPPVAAPAAPAPAPKAPAEPPRAKPAAPAPSAASGPKAAKPALLADSVRSHQTPAPYASGAAAPPAAAPAPAAAAQAADKRHSVPVEFRLKAPRARHVQLVGAFIVHGGRKDMVRQDGGVWAVTLYLLPGTEYRYWFAVDGKKSLDPENHQVVRGASVLSLP